MNPGQQAELLLRGAEEVLPADALLRRIEECQRTAKPLRVKQGFDPTAPDIHLGHSVGLRKLRQFQDLGHQVVLIVGDYTGRVGDPSGRSKTRPQLTEEQVEENARTYLDQFFRVLDRNPHPPQHPVEIHRNGEWFSRMSFMEVIRLTSHYTVARLLERDDFSKRFAAQHPIGVHELLYPLMQGYDSVAIRSDVELGGTDQKFNLLVGRALQEAFGQSPQIVFTVPLLPGLDGVQRMSKSLGNYVGVTDPPREMYGKLMSIPDGVMPLYWRLLTDADPGRLRQIEGDLASGDVNPKNIKMDLARAIVSMYHGDEASATASHDFELQFGRKGVPDDLEEIHRDALAAIPAHGDGATIIEAMMAARLAKSKSDARRLVQQGAVSVDGERVTSIEGKVDPDSDWVLRVGRKMIRYRPDRP